MIPSIIISCVIALGGPVIRWSSPVPIEGEEISFSDRGVAVRPEGEIVPIIIPWYDVKSVPNGWTGEALEHEKTAALARVARDRRLRGDPVAAAESYQQLDTQIHPAHGDQALDISIGLMESAVAMQRADPEQAISNAIVPWLRTVRLGAKSNAASRGLIDPSTGLHPAVIPVFRMSPVTIELHGSLGEREAILHGYFQLAIENARGDTTEEAMDALAKRVRLLDHRDSGIALVQEIVKCQVSQDSTDRKAAREALRRRLRSNSSGWMDSWIHLAIGVSLLDESDPLDRERGVIECVTVVVSSRETPQSVVQLASDFAGEYLRATDRDQYADTLAITAYMKNESPQDSQQ